MLCLLYFLLVGLIHLFHTIPVSSVSCSTQKADSPYDYIVIGSGPGGSTIATRLALNDFKVLLIEAGPDYDDILTRTLVFWAEIQLNETFFYIVVLQLAKS